MGRSLMSGENDVAISWPVTTRDGNTVVSSSTSPTRRLMRLESEYTCLVLLV